MGKILTQEIVDLLADSDSSRIFATVDEKGFPHAVAGAPLRVDEQGNLLYLEYFESSETNKNLTRSIWFDGNVAIALSNKAGQLFQIKGRPVKNHITGALFLKYYREVSSEPGNVNLAAVWEIEPLEVINEGAERRREYERTTRPFFTHLDRIAR
jgi:hypothetical protein